jgi:ribosomal-protein-alanine N-acetyltransferase
MGYGTKMLSLGTRIAIQDMELHRVEAFVLPENTPSIRMLERCGYELEGLAREYVRLRGQWTDHYRYVFRG